MANRRFTSQFSYSFERQAVRLMGSFEQTDLGAFAARTINGITYTAVTMGAAGNSITIALVNGGTAGAEVVTVTGSAISILMDATAVTGSSRQDIVDAIAAEPAAAALVVATGGSATVATASSALALQSGDDTDFDESSSVMTLSQIGTGLFQLDLPDSYAALIGCSIQLQASSAADLAPQIKSVDVLDDQQIIFRMQAGSSPTNLANGDVLYISLELRNSSNVGLGGG